VLAALALDESAVDNEGKRLTVEERAKENKRLLDLLPQKQDETKKKHDDGPKNRQAASLSLSEAHEDHHDWRENFEYPKKGGIIER